jgi:biopolymer transport protein ExbD
MNAPFKRRGAMHGWQTRFGPNMTPMVDVVMVILIFFMASTALIGPEWRLRIGLASDKPALAGFQLGPADLLIRLELVGGSIVFTGLGRENTPMSALELEAAGAASALGTGINETRITIEAGPGVPYEAVVQTHDALAGAGFGRVAIR